MSDEQLLIDLRRSQAEVLGLRKRIENAGMKWASSCDEMGYVYISGLAIKDLESKVKIARKYFRKIKESKNCLDFCDEIATQALERIEANSWTKHGK